MNKCIHCKGTGLDPLASDDCEACSGDGITGPYQGRAKTETKLRASVEMGSTGYQLIYWRDSLIGALEMDVDGYFKFWPSSDGGCWDELMMQEIADTLKRLNAEWDEKVKRECGEPIHPSTF